MSEADAATFDPEAAAYDDGQPFEVIAVYAEGRAERAPEFSKFRAAMTDPRQIEEIRQLQAKAGPGGHARALAPFGQRLSARVLLLAGATAAALSAGVFTGINIMSTPLEASAVSAEELAATGASANATRSVSVAAPRQQVESPDRVTVAGTVASPPPAIQGRAAPAAPPIVAEGVSVAAVRPSSPAAREIAAAPAVAATSSAVAVGGPLIAAAQAAEHVPADDAVAPPSVVETALAVPPAPAKPALAASPERAASQADGGYRVQLAMLRHEQNVKYVWHDFLAQFGPLHDGLRRYVFLEDTPRGPFHVVQVGPFGAAGAAEAMCGAIKQRGGDCIVVHRAS